VKVRPVNADAFATLSNEQVFVPDEPPVAAAAVTLVAGAAAGDDEAATPEGADDAMAAEAGASVAAVAVGVFVVDAVDDFEPLEQPASATATRVMAAAEDAVSARMASPRLVPATGRVTATQSTTRNVQVIPTVAWFLGQAVAPTRRCPAGMRSTDPVRANVLDVLPRGRQG
jgi:hypothetical protein